MAPAAWADRRLLRRTGRNGVNTNGLNMRGFDVICQVSREIRQRVLICAADDDAGAGLPGAGVYAEERAADAGQGITGGERDGDRADVPVVAPQDAVQLGLRLRRRPVITKSVGHTHSPTVIYVARAVAQPEIEVIAALSRQRDVVHHLHVAKDAILIGGRRRAQAVVSAGDA